MACWIRLTEGQATTSQKEEGSREIAQTTNKIHHSSLTLCCRSVLSSPLLGVAALGAFSSYARARAAGPVNRAPAGQTRVARGEKGRGVGRSRRDENTTRVAITANCTPARRPIPSARARSIAALASSDFVDGTPFPSTARYLGRCANASEVWLGPIDPGYFFNPLGEGTLRCVFRRGTGNPPNRVQTPLKQAPEGRGARRNHKTRRHG